MKHYIGVDHHKKFSYMTVMDERGKVVKEGRVANSQGAVNKFLGEKYREGTSAVLEAGRNWTVMHDWLEELVAEVVLAHPVKVRAIAEAKIKTDKIDAKILAHLLRSDLVPKAYVSDKETRKVKNILRQRMFFVKMLTMVKNRVHTIVDRHPDVIGDLVFSDLFGRQGIEWLKKAPFPKEDRKLLDEDIDIIEYLRGKISSSDQLVASLGKKDKRVELLMTIPGIGKFFALLIVNEIGDIGRFRNKNKFASYAGLVPSVYASGGRIVHGRIVKSGNKYLRWALIEAVWPAIKKDIDLEEVYQSLKMRKGANQAKVAIARRLSVIVYRVLSQQRPYYISSGRPHFSVAEAIH